MISLRINKLIITSIFVLMANLSIGAELESVYGSVNFERFDKRISRISDELEVFSLSAFSENTLPVLYSRFISEFGKEKKRFSLMEFRKLYPISTAGSRSKERTEAIKRLQYLDKRELASEVHRYVEFCEYAKVNANFEVDKILKLLPKSKSQKRLVLLSLLFATEDFKYLSVINRHRDNKRANPIKGKTRGIPGFYAADPAFFWDGYKTYDSASFYRSCEISALVKSFTDFWLIPSGNEYSDFNKFYEERQHLKYFTTQFYVKLVRANILRTGLPDRAKISALREEINMLPQPDRALTFIALTKIETEARRIFPSDIKKSIFLAQSKIKDQKKVLLITEKELLAELGQIPKEIKEKILTSEESITIDPDFTPHRKNIFYTGVVKYLLDNRMLFWSEKEYQELIRNANSVVRDIIEKSISLSDKQE